MALCVALSLQFEPAVANTSIVVVWLGGTIAATKLFRGLAAPIYSIVCGLCFVLVLFFGGQVGGGKNPISIIDRLILAIVAAAVSGVCVWSCVCLIAALFQRIDRKWQ